MRVSLYTYFLYFFLYNLFFYIKNVQRPRFHCFLIRLKVFYWVFVPLVIELQLNKDLYKCRRKMALFLVEGNLRYWFSLKNIIYKCKIAGHGSTVVVWDFGLLYHADPRRVRMGFYCACCISCFSYHCLCSKWPLVIYYLAGRNGLVAICILYIKQPFIVHGLT